MLKDTPSVLTQKALESGFLSDVLKTGEINTICQRMKQEQFERMCGLVEKTVDPQDLIVTRPHETDTYHRGNPEKEGKYQMRFWKKEMGFIKPGGHVSDGGGSHGFLLFEYYSSRPQGQISYPNEVMDLDRMYQSPGRETGYCWHKETVEKDCQFGRKETVDVFTLRKVSGKIQ